MRDEAVPCRAVPSLPREIQSTDVKYPVYEVGRGVTVEPQCDGKLPVMCALTCDARVPGVRCEYSDKASTVRHLAEVTTHSFSHARRGGVFPRQAGAHSLLVDYTIIVVNAGYGLEVTVQLLDLVR